MEDKTDVARVTLPVLFKSLLFQDANRACIFSMMRLKSLLFDLPWSIGKPKYFSREVMLWIPDMWDAFRIREIDSLH